MKKILIVDDNEMDRYMLQVLLTSHGYEVVTAANGAEALEIAGRKRPDMIITDILMPVLDGFSLCRKWKRDPPLQDIPFVFYTATFTGHRDRELALSLGADQFIVKPTEPEVFLDMLLEVIRRHEASQLTVHHDLEEESVYLRQYNEALIRKLEDKLVELEEVNQVMKQEIIMRKEVEEALRKAHEEMEARVAERTAELSQTNKALELSNQALDEFAAVASHDLQEPLRKILFFGDHLAARFFEALGEEGAGYLKRMQNAALRMRALVTALLNYSRVATKPEPFSPVDLQKLVEGILADLEVRINETRGVVEAGEFPLINADTHMMRQLFQNLIGNALKYHHPQRHPIIKVRVVPYDNTYFQILVEDNGIGFDEKYSERIFAPFQRLHGRSEYEGAGLGLAICRKIVEHHNGAIIARSTPGEGSVFIVTLPRTLLLQKIENAA